jgi:hypothetical protein
MAHQIQAVLVVQDFAPPLRAQEFFTRVVVVAHLILELL